MEKQESLRESRAPEKKGGLLREELQLCSLWAGQSSLRLEPQLEVAVTEHSKELGFCFQEPL